MATAQASTNAVLAIADGASPLGYDQIQNIGDFEIGFDTSMHRTDSHSTANAWGSQIPGIKMGKDIDLTVFFDPDDAEHTWHSAGGLGYVANARTTLDFMYYPVGFPTKAIFFTAYVTSPMQVNPVDGVLSMTFKLSPTGPFTFGDGTGLLN